MPEINLKAYTTEIKEIESAICTQKRLMVQHRKLLDIQKPKAPEKKNIDMPKGPVYITNSEGLFNSGDIVLLTVGIIGTLLFLPLSILFIICFQEINFILILFSTLACTIFKILLGFEIYKYYYKKNLNLKEKKSYENQIKYYNDVLLNEYNIEKNIEEENYKNSLILYSVNIAKYNQDYKEKINSHNIALSMLEKKLKDLYDEDIIFPKYRNLVAITSINEYLLSGRCDKLEGPDGAYNLYETELRQNIIISQISAAIENLEEIKFNQFSLYQEIQNSNILINDILSEAKDINKSAKLMAYFSEITAKAETSPKYYCGVSF